MTRAERAHYARLSALGCVVCNMLDYPGSPAEIHHLRTHTGAGQKSHYTRAIPLCPIHHRQGDGSERFNGALGYHVAPRTWEQKYGTQEAFLRSVNELIGVAA